MFSCVSGACVMSGGLTWAGKDPLYRRWRGAPLTTGKASLADSGHLDRCRKLGGRTGRGLGRLSSRAAPSPSYRRRRDSRGAWASGLGPNTPKKTVERQCPGPRRPPRMRASGIPSIHPWQNGIFPRVPYTFVAARSSQPRGRGIRGRIHLLPCYARGALSTCQWAWGPQTCLAKRNCSC